MSEILFIGHRIPFPPDRGDKIRSYHILRRLAELAPVHVACFADDAADMAHEPALADMSASHGLIQRSKPLALAGFAALARGLPVSLTAFADPRLSAYVNHVLATRPIGAIYVFSGQMGQYVPASFGGRVVIDLVDVDSAKFGAYATTGNAARRWLYAREERLLRAEEARLVDRADRTLLVSREEVVLLSDRLPSGFRGDVRALGNGIDTQRYDPAGVLPSKELAGCAGPVLIFTGQMDYAPNVAAAVRGATRIMPAIRKAFPEATFEVVGRQPTAEVLALDGVNGCRVRGAVDDIRPWLRGADLALVPLEIARGIQNKVLEAMAMGLPVVASTGAATGIPARSGTELFAGADDAALIAATLALLTDRAMAQAMGDAARRFVQATHGWEAVLATLPDAMAIEGERSVANAA